MSRPIRAADYVEHFDPELAHHRAWLQAVLEHLVAHEPQALEEGGVLRVLWKAAVETKAPQARPEKPATATDLPAAIAVAFHLVKEFEGCQLSAYPDPETGAYPWTIGCGSTTYKDGTPVKAGDTISQELADALLERRLARDWSLLVKLVPGWRQFNVNQQFGDTTDPAAQIQALASYGITARFSNQASISTLEEQIAAGIPVPCGYLHRGPISRPAGGGHWLIVVGITPTHLIVHDPFGEADLVNGITIGGAARYSRYSRSAHGSGLPQQSMRKPPARPCWCSPPPLPKASPETPSPIFWMWRQPRSRR